MLMPLKDMFVTTWMIMWETLIEVTWGTSKDVTWAASVEVGMSTRRQANPLCIETTTWLILKWPHGWSCWCWAWAASIESACSVLLLLVVTFSFSRKRGFDIMSMMRKKIFSSRRHFLVVFNSRLRWEVSWITFISITAQHDCINLY